MLESDFIVVLLSKSNIGQILGRKVSTVLDPDALLFVSTGLTQVKVEPIYDKSVDPQNVLNLLETQREQGTLISAVTSSVMK